MFLIAILSILLFNFNTMKSVHNERHCNFSRYMLNYFKLNEHYLLQMYKNFDMYTKEDLKKYGRAFQTHGDVVLLMIEDLHKINKNIVAYDLMTVNLYLNNNSGSINVMYKYQAELVPNVTEENVMHIHDIIFEKGNQVELYLQKLHKYRNSLHSIFVTQCLGNITSKVHRRFLPQNLIDHLCTDNPIDYCKSTNDECVINDESSELNIYDIGNNDGLDEFKITNIENIKNAIFNSKKEKSLNPSIDMKDSPKHMVDYFISSA
ncbi:uncharacterized protein LOC126901793 isoform X2 [Daktulosphaira vitifoliae]|uniref:uncharacterized protein LOC126901793 isoform X2 n=1 Tax=Daktulosphaira vitifoliae TaxID=58002 RepID=UPI0021A98121|nr:uncharacterized protein LOC126901793 isoform X2 [Daktulosphaira vitifoliae]